MSLSWALGTFTFVDPFIHRKVLKITFYNCIHVKMDIIKAALYIYIFREYSYIKWVL